MKKQYLFISISLIFLVAICLFTSINNTATGQDTSSSSSSSGEPVVENTSSSSGETIVENTSSSSGDVATISLNQDFTGIWKARVERPTTDMSMSVLESSSGGSPDTMNLLHLSEEAFGSSIITFKLCVTDGILEGTVHQGGAFNNGRITSQNVISENEVQFTAESGDMSSGLIFLRLTGEREFFGFFSDDHEFEGRKLNPNRGCLQSDSMSGTGMSGQGMNDLGEPTTSGGPGFEGGMAGPGGMSGGPHMGEPGMGMGGEEPGDLGEPTTSGGPGFEGSGDMTGFGMGGSGSMGGPGMGGPGMSMGGGEEPGDLGEPTTPPEDFGEPTDEPIGMGNMETPGMDNDDIPSMSSSSGGPNMGVSMGEGQGSPTDEMSGPPGSGPTSGGPSMTGPGMDIGPGMSGPPS